MVERRNEGLLVRTLPLGMAEQICRRLVNRLVNRLLVVDGVVELNTDPAWAEAINAVVARRAS